MDANRYPLYQQVSGWNALLPPRQARPALDADSSADVVIVGAGFTGIAAARRWRELSEEADILLLDASEVGEGNPGRNSGFLLEIALAEDADPERLAHMAQCNSLTASTLLEISGQLQAAGQPVDMERVGTYRAAASAAGSAALAKYRAFLEGAGLPHDRLDRNQLQQRLGTGFFREGLYSPHCYLAQPAALIRALAASLPESIRLHENTPVTSLERGGGRWLLDTPGGRVSAGQVILANNAYARGLGAGRSTMVAIHTYAALTPVLPPELAASLGSDSCWGLLPAHRLGSTLRRTRDDRLLIRSVYDYERQGDADSIRRQLRARMGSRFPQLEGIEFEHLWGGAVGYTFNGGVVWGEVKPGLFVSAGCNGGGTVKGTLFGKLLAEHANGLKVPDVTKLFGKASWMPPEPLRRLGFHINAGWERYRGRAEI